MGPRDWLRSGRQETAPLPGMVRAEELARARRGDGWATGASAPPTDPALVTRRERLAERLTLMQLELGGLFYEMAIRDHVQMELLLNRAGQLQRVDAELAHVDQLLASGPAAVGGVCGSCQAPHARGAAFCWQCGKALDNHGDDAATTELDAADA